MTKIYVVFRQKWSEWKQNKCYETIEVFTNRKQALAFCKLNTNNIHRYWYYEFDVNKCDYISVAEALCDETELQELLKKKAG